MEHHLHKSCEYTAVTNGVKENRHVLFMMDVKSKACSFVRTSRPQEALHDYQTSAYKTKLFFPHSPCH